MFPTPPGLRKTESAYRFISIEIGKAVDAQLHNKHSSEAIRAELKAQSAATTHFRELHSKLQETHESVSKRLSLSNALNEDLKVQLTKERGEKLQLQAGMHSAHDKIKVCQAY